MIVYRNRYPLYLSYSKDSKNFPLFPDRLIEAGLQNRVILSGEQRRVYFKDLPADRQSLVLAEPERLAEFPLGQVVDVAGVTLWGAGAAPEALQQDFGLSAAENLKWKVEIRREAQPQGRLSCAWRAGDDH